MALNAVEQKENVHHPIHLVAGLLVVGKRVLQALHPQVERQIVHNHHLLLDHRRLPTELVVYYLEGGTLYSRVSGLGPS